MGDSPPKLPNGVPWPSGHPVTGEPLVYFEGGAVDGGISLVGKRDDSILVGRFFTEEGAWAEAHFWRGEWQWRSFAVGRPPKARHRG
jgi:hypothetical protein